MSLDQLKNQSELLDLCRFLNVLCSVEGNIGFTFRLAKQTSRWATVEDLLSETAKHELHQIAFNPQIASDGFSAGNLKAHYVLDEDFINNGSAIIIFSLVGTLWTHVENVSNQNEFTSAEIWLDGKKL